MKRADLKCTVYPFQSLKKHLYVVVCTRYRDVWILSRHKARETWELQGGHIEPGETVLSAARRELFEESGIVKADLYPLCDYIGYDSESSANGSVFLAVAHEFGVLPESEMAETAGFKTIPSNLTYPLAAPVFIRLAEQYMNQFVQSK